MKPSWARSAERIGVIRGFLGMAKGSAGVETCFMRGHEGLGTPQKGFTVWKDGLDGSHKGFLQGREAVTKAPKALMGPDRGSRWAPRSLHGRTHECADTVNLTPESSTRGVYEHR